MRNLTKVLAPLFLVGSLAGCVPYGGGSYGYADPGYAVGPAYSPYGPGYDSGYAPGYAYGPAYAYAPEPNYSLGFFFGGSGGGYDGGYYGHGDNHWRKVDSDLRIDLVGLRERRRLPHDST